jgi:hypothetical protein
MEPPPATVEVDSHCPVRIGHVVIFANKIINSVEWDSSS